MFYDSQSREVHDKVFLLIVASDATLKFSPLVLLHAQQKEKRPLRTKNNIEL